MQQKVCAAGAEKGIGWESQAIRSLYSGSEVRKNHCAEREKEGQKRRTVSQETCSLPRLDRLPVKAVRENRKIGGPSVYGSFVMAAA